MKGRKPTATVVKLVTGNPGRRPLNTREAKPAAKIPEPPETLSELAQKEWDRVTPILAGVGLISHLDLAVVVAYCTAYGRWQECEAELKKTGLIIRAPNGFPMYSPYFNAVNKCLEQVRQFAEQIGLSGSSRSRIKADDGGREIDPAEAFLNGTK